MDCSFSKDVDITATVCANNYNKIFKTRVIQFVCSVAELYKTTSSEKDKFIT